MQISYPTSSGLESYSDLPQDISYALAMYVIYELTKHRRRNRLPIGLLTPHFGRKGQGHPGLIMAR